VHRNDRLNVEYVLRAVERSCVEIGVVPTRGKCVPTDFLAGARPKVWLSDRLPDPTVFIVDDDEAVLDSIAELMSSVGLHAATFRSARQFRDVFDPQQPGCLVLDVRMAHMSGPALQEELNAIGACIPIVFISGHGDIPVAIKTIKAGAVDFVQKPYHEQQLLDSINEALRRDTATRKTTGVNDGFAERFTTLTERERAVMDHVVGGLSSKSIAKALNISYRTVELHRSHIMDKLGVHSVAELMHLVARRRDA
jgi:FixJ family two-component response regulator